VSSLCKIWPSVDDQDLPIPLRGLTYSLHFDGDGREGGDTKTHLEPNKFGANKIDMKFIVVSELIL
jgi:hypothetical protein